MRGGITIAGIALAAMLCPGLALAEVRLLEDTSGVLSVEVDSTPRGPWTPMGSVTSVILNPSGDLFGDGMPGWDSRGSRVLSAWIRPGSGILHRSLGTSPGWRPLNPIASPGAQGQPVVDDLTDGWGITWQQAATAGAQVLVTGTTVDGIEVAPIVVSTGTLIGTSPAGNLLQVITLEGGTGYLWCTTVSFSFIPTQPIPISLQIVARVRLGRSGLTGGFGAPTSQGQGQGLGRRELRAIEVVEPPRVLDVLRRDGTTAGLVTWWGEDGDLHGVALASEGPVLPGLVIAWRPGRSHAEDALDALLAQVSSSP